MPALVGGDRPNRVAGLDLLDHRHQRLLLCLVPLEQGNLEREPTGGHQQPDRHLGVDPMLLADPHPAEPVLIGHLEVQRAQGHNHQPDRPTGVGVPPTGGRDLAVIIRATQRAKHLYGVFSCGCPRTTSQCPTLDTSAREDEEHAV